MWCHFFGVQNPLTVPPLRIKCPNFKLFQFFEWLQYIWKVCWELGPTVSANEQTCSMQGQSIYKTWCGKNKRIGDRIQTDAIADDGYTWDFYFRNEPIPKIWLDMGLSPMHGRLLHMFENFRDNHHCVNMDNLFNSFLFMIATANFRTKLKNQGMLQKSVQEAPPCIMQEEVKWKAAKSICGTVKDGSPQGQSMIRRCCCCIEL